MSTTDTPSRKRRKAGQTKRNLVTLLVLVLALALLLGGVWKLVLPLFEPVEAATDYPGPGTGTVEIAIDDPAPDAIAAVLTASDVVATEQAFVAAYTANPQATSIVAGTYSLPMQMTAADAVTALLDPASRIDLTLTIPDGWRASQILSKIAEVLAVPLADVNAAASDVTLPAEAGGNVEGWLASGTYTVPPGALPAEVMQQMVDRTLALLTTRGVAEGSWQSVLTQASIVEAEVSDPESRGMVARVLLNRLGGCADVGQFLQMDSTVAYGLSKSVYDLTLADLSDADSRYNTFIYEGLPPTPIDSPSEQSLDAVLAPPEGTWCYFTTVNLETGEVRFTDDPAVHEANRAEYRAWLEQWQATQGGTTEPTTPAQG